MELFVIVLLLLLVNVYLIHMHNKERAQLINRIIAKNFDEIRELDRSQPKKDAMAEEETLPPTIVPLEEIESEDFNAIIRRELGRETAIEKAKRTLKEKVHAKVV